MTRMCTSSCRWWAVAVWNALDLMSPRVLPVCSSAVSSVPAAVCRRTDGTASIRRSRLLRGSGRARRGGCLRLSSRSCASSGVVAVPISFMPAFRAARICSDANSPKTKLETAGLTLRTASNCASKSACRCPSQVLVAVLVCGMRSAACAVNEQAAKPGLAAQDFAAAARIRRYCSVGNPPQPQLSRSTSSITT